MYSVSEIVEYMVRKYDLYDKESNITSYKAQVRRVLRELGIWDHSVREEGKTSKRLFTREQMLALLNSERMHDYYIDNSKSKEISSRKKLSDYERELGEWRERYIESLDERQNDSVDSENVLTTEEVGDHAQKLMIRALFDLFYEWIDENSFAEDLNTLTFRDDLGPTVQVLEAEERLSHPEGIYYRKR